MGNLFTQSEVSYFDVFKVSEPQLHAVVVSADKAINMKIHWNEHHRAGRNSGRRTSL